MKQIIQPTLAPLRDRQGPMNHGIALVAGPIQPREEERSIHGTSWMQNRRGRVRFHGVCVAAEVTRLRSVFGWVMGRKSPY
jgi:hypothetical protein